MASASSPSFISTTIRSGLRLLRRNAARIALVTAVAGSAIAATAYMRRQYREINDSLANERRQGARSLRAAFVTSSHTLSTTFIALLPRLASSISACAAADASPALARLHERPTDRAEKTALWHSVRDASITALLSAIYLSATLHATLSMQLHLLARYAAAPPDAPVQSLPAGPLRAPTSKRLLEACSRYVAGPARAATVVETIASHVRSRFADLPLAKPLPLADLHARLHEILCVVAEAERPASAGDPHTALVGDPLFANAVGGDSGASGADAGGHGTSSGVAENGGNHSSDAALASNATASEDTPDASLVEAAIPSTDAAILADENLQWLAREALDLCDVLAIEEVITSGASAALDCALAILREDVAGSGTEGTGVNPDTVPFAHMLGKLAAAATKVTSVDGGESMIEMALREDETCQHFAAAVFLSGEKQNDNNNSERDAGRDVLAAITDGQGMTRNGSGNNLGLMFDMPTNENDLD